MPVGPICADGQQDRQPDPDAVKDGNAFLFRLNFDTHMAVTRQLLEAVRPTVPWAAHIAHRGRWWTPLAAARLPAQPPGHLRPWLLRLHSAAYTDVPGEVSEEGPRQGTGFYRSPSALPETQPVKR